MNLVLNVLTPRNVIYSDRVKEVICPTRTGQVGLLLNHLSLFTVVDVNVLLFRDVLESVNFYWRKIVLVGGFRYFLKDELIFVVNDAIKSARIDISTAEKFLIEAINDLNKSIKQTAEREASIFFKRARVLYELTKIN